MGASKSHAAPDADDCLPPRRLLRELSRQCCDRVEHVLAGQIETGESDGADGVVVDAFQQAVAVGRQLHGTAIQGDDRHAISG
jgi:hypothetical protein